MFFVKQIDLRRMLNVAQNKTNQNTNYLNDQWVGIDRDWRRNREAKK